MFGFIDSYIEDLSLKNSYPFHQFFELKRFIHIRDSLLPVSTMEQLTEFQLHYLILDYLDNFDALAIDSKHQYFRSTYDLVAYL